MSKLSFRARAIDANKPMPVFKTDEIPELLDFAAVNRAVMEMPTGMEKEEETEHHLQRALSAQQVYGSAEMLVIPIPDVDCVGDRYLKLYVANREFRAPKQYIHVQPFGMDQEIPEYDMDSEDEVWLNKQVKHLKMDVPPIKFESMMDRLEKGSGQMVVTLNEAKALLKVDDDLITAVYDYWLSKRLRLQHPLIPQVKTEKRDGTTTSNPYVAFRRRTEKMQTRKNRKNDEVSYEKMLKLRKDLNKALIILELLKRREKSKKELLKLTIEVAEKRYQMQDWEGKLLAEANAKKHTLPSYFPIAHRYPVSREWEQAGGSAKEPGVIPRKKREYKKRKHKQPVMPTVTGPAPQAAVHLPNYVDISMVLHRGRTVSSDDDLSGGSQSDHETDNDPDGVYAFRRLAGCSYLAPRCTGQGSWPWVAKEDGGLGDSRYRYSLACVPTDVPSSPALPRPTSRQRCSGFVRRRIGRGGRVLFDRGLSDWNDQLSNFDIFSSASDHSSEYLHHIRESAIPLYRTKSSYGSSRHALEKTCEPHTPLISHSIADGIILDDNLSRHLHHPDQRLSLASNDEIVDPLTCVEVSTSSDIKELKLPAAVSLFTETETTSTTLLRLFSASAADTNGISVDPTAAKLSCSSGQEPFNMPNTNSSLASNDQPNSVAALPTADGSSPSVLASFSLTGSSASSVSSRLSFSSNVNNASTWHSLALSRQSDSSNTRVIDGHLTSSSDGIRFMSASAAAASSLPNHSSLCREPSVTCRPASLSFVSTPGLKLTVGSQMNHKENVTRENHDSVSTTDQTAFIMEVT